MSKKIFSDINILKKRLGKQGDADWDDVLNAIAESARSFIVSKIGWDVEEQDVVEYVDGFGDGPIILKHEHMTSLDGLEIFNGVDYTAVDTLPRFFEDGTIDFYLRKGFKVAKVSYKAGFKIDFVNRDDPAKHNLPADIEELSNRLISKIFLNKQELGKKSVSFEGATTSFAQLLEPTDIAIIKTYKRLWT